MTNKDYVKVPFDRSRFELLLENYGFSIKTIAALSGVSRATISRAMKNGYINEKHLKKIAAEVLCTKEFLTGDKKLDNVAKAFAVVNKYIAEVRALEKFEEE